MASKATLLERIDNAESALRVVRDNDEITARQYATAVRMLKAAWTTINDPEALTWAISDVPQRPDW